MSGFELVEGSDIFSLLYDGMVMSTVILIVLVLLFPLHAC